MDQGGASIHRINKLSSTLKPSLEALHWDLQFKPHVGMLEGQRPRQQRKTTPFEAVPASRTGAV